MARLLGPLLSIEARKKLAGLKIYQKRLDRTRVIKYSKPYQKNPANPSPSQLNQRMIYNLIIARWQTMTDGEKAPFIAAVNSDRLQMSPWNYFLKEARKDLYTHLGLAAYWSFNRIVGGKVLDLSGNGNDGEPKPSYPDDCPKLAAGIGGKFGQAISFDGNNDYLNIGNNTSLKPPLPFTISLLLKGQPAPSGAGLLQNDNWYTDYTGNYYGGNLQLLSTRKIAISFGDGGAPASSSRRTKVGTTPLIVGRWYFIATVLKGAGDMDIYINAKDDGGSYSGGGGNLTYSSAAARIGECGENYHFPGLLDEVRIFNRALSQPELQKHYEIYSKYK